MRAAKDEVTQYSEKKGARLLDNCFAETSHR